MCATEGNPEIPTPATADGMLQLPHICLDFQLRQDAYRSAFTGFLEKHRDQLGLDGGDDLVETYLERVWPDNLPNSFIIANISLQQHPQWLIRPAADGPLSSSYAAGSFAPAFRVYWRSGTLVVCGFELAPHVLQRPFEARVSGVIHRSQTDQLMSMADKTALEAIPRHRQQTEQKLIAWREYLDWKERLAHISQVALRYDRIEAVHD